MFNGKKGQEELVLPPIFLIAIGLGIVFLAILYAVIRIGTNEAYDRQRAIMSIGLDFQSIQSFGKDVNAERDITDAGPYYLVFESGKVYTKARGVQTSSFLYTHVPGFFFRGGEFYPEKSKKTIGPLKLFKHGQLYGIARPANLPSQYLLVCDTPAGPPLKSLAVDPGHGYDGTNGEEGKPIPSLGTTESKYTMRLARTFSISSGTKINPTRALDVDSFAALDARQKTAGDALLSFHVGSRNDDKDVVKAYYNAENPNSRRLACEILNALATELKIPVRPIPVNADNTADDAKKVLKGRPAVLIEIGNAKKTDSILKDTGTIAAAVYNGVKAYGVA